MSNGYIQWHATNGNNPANKTQQADTMASAVAMAKRYIQAAFSGEGRAVVTVNGQPKKQITRSADGQWVTQSV